MGGSKTHARSDTRLRSPWRARRRSWLVLFLVALAAASASAAAEQGAEPVDFEALEADRAAKASRFPIGPRITRYLNAAQKEMEDERPEDAEKTLLRLEPEFLNPFERASVYRFLAYAANTAGNTDGAIGYFEKVLDEQVLKLHDESKIRLAIAQLSAQQEDWSGVVRWIDRYVRFTEEPDPLSFYLKALAHYQSKELDASIAAIRQAIETAGEPREAWLRLLSALHSQKEDFRAAAPVLEELLLRFPKKQYWVQLSLIYGAIEDYPRSLAVQQIAYAEGYLTEDKELQRLARSYLFQELPYPAAKVLERGLAEGQIEPDSEVYTILANSWIAAREYERALPPLRKAAELSKDGKLYVRLAQVLMQRERWLDSAEVLQKAVDKGGLDSPGRAMLLLGISWYNAERVADARKFFLRARGFDKTRKEADTWLGHIARETPSEPG